jgi:hypothetical protein
MTVRYICDLCGNQAPPDQDNVVAIQRGSLSLMIRPIGCRLCETCLPTALEAVRRKLKGEPTSSDPPPTA